MPGGRARALPYGATSCTHDDTFVPLIASDLVQVPDAAGSVQSPPDSNDRDLTRLVAESKPSGGDGAGTWRDSMRLVTELQLSIDGNSRSRSDAGRSASSRVVQRDGVGAGRLANALRTEVQSGSGWTRYPAPGPPRSWRSMVKQSLRMPPPSVPG
jgi:hypothetical protein